MESETTRMFMGLLTPDMEEFGSAVVSNTPSMPPDA
jgi:hypothetical protein